MVAVSPHRHPRPFVKRLVGKPGDKITIIDDGDMLNNKEISREKIQVIECFDAALPKANTMHFSLYRKIEDLKHLFHKNMESKERDKIVKIEQLPEVPPGFYFVMGDLTEIILADSRYWGFCSRS